MTKRWLKFFIVASLAAFLFAPDARAAQRTTPNQPTAQAGGATSTSSGTHKAKKRRKRGGRKKGSHGKGTKKPSTRPQ